MLQLQTAHEGKKDFLLKDQLKEEQLSTLHFLLNSQHQIARQKFEEKTPFQTEIKKYQRSVAINPQQLKALFNALSQKLREKFIRQDSECLKGLNKLQTLWESKKIQMFHRYYFQKYIENTYLKNILTLLKNEEHLIRMDQHIYYSIQKTIWAREACLNHIKRQLRVLGPQDVYEHIQTLKDREIEANRKMEQKIYKVYGYRAKYILDQRQTKLGQTKMELLSQGINGYRKLTYHLIELICNWKLYIQSLTHDLRLRREKLQFYHFDHNYLLAILNDSSFISTSFLSNFYTFAVKNDPFLLKPILNIEKTMEEGGQTTFQTHQLKRIIDCKIEDVSKIMLALCQLQKQVEWNIRHKKYAEKNGLIKYRSVNLQRHQSQSTVKSKKQVKLPNLPSQPSIKRAFSQIKKQKSGLVKSNIFERKTSLVEDLAKPINTFQSKNFRINNPEAKPSFKLFQSQEILALKQEIYNKVKQQLDNQTKKSILGSKMFADLIDKQVKASFQKHLYNEEQQIMRNTLQITALSFAEQEISSFITNIYKEIPVQYSALQTQQSDLLKDITQASYCYILKVHTKEVDVANIVALCNRQNTQYKSVQVKLVSFKFEETFEKIVLKLVQFLWKYDNVKEIGFSLRYASQQAEKFVKLLCKKLQQNCTVIEKRHKRDFQARFVFMNKDFNKRYVYNPHPQKVHFKLYATLCLQRLQLQSTNIEDLARNLNYDYLIMEILRKFTNSEDFYILRDKFQPKSRYRYLLAQLMEIQNHKQHEVQMTILEEENMTNLNGKLRYMKRPLLQVSDLILINNVKLMMLEYTLTVAYRLNVLSPGKGQICHRYSIHEDIPYICDNKGTQFYMLPVQQSHHLNIIVFSADDYMNHSKKDLNLYLFQTLERHKWTRKHVTNMWIQMLRYPYKFTARQQFMMSTYRVHDFDSINKELLIGDTFDWYTDIQIQNGIQYAIEKGDLHLKLPLGIGIITNKNWVLYSRILQEGPKFVSENA